MSDEPKKPENLSPEMRRAVSRRSLITDELGKHGVQALKHLPSLGPLLGFALRETVGQRDERLVTNLWELFMGRKPKPEESKAGLDLVREAKTPDAKADALVDIMWALTQTQEFEDLKRSDRMLVRGIYRIALDREPNENERDAALNVLGEATEQVARTAALEGLFTGLLRSANSVLRKDPGRR